MSTSHRARKPAVAGRDDSEDDPYNESFILFGTEFPEPTEKQRRQGIEDPGKFQPVWNQEVTDEKGRRRFHGAFTGGFSAGYYNTVGSKEGWQPSTFISSRSTRQEQKGARPEDFMDEEDLEEIANARKLVATEEFDLLGGTERELSRKREMDQLAEKEGGILGAQAFQDFVVPSKDPIGVKLLRKMGWRPGQGVGARISAAKRRKLVMEESDQSDEELDADVTFAPRDSAIIVFAQKRDTFGLGFDPYKNVPDIANVKRARAERANNESSGKDSGYNKVGFGVGVLDDDGDDDDVYDNASNNYTTELYDTGFDEEEHITIGRGLKKASHTSQARRHKESRHSSKRVGFDGRVPISGFEHGANDVLQEKWFPPPQVPANFKPVHVFSEPGPKPEKKDIAVEMVGHQNRPDLSFEERGSLLGEKPIEPRSVFDYVSSRSKDRLDNLLSGITASVSNEDRSRLNNIPKVDKKDAMNALRGFLPFGENIKKQARYRTYLEGQAGLLNDDGSPVVSMDIPEGLTYDEAHKELDEFVKAARIFRPISAMMSSRFTSASPANATQIQGSEGGLRTESEWKKEKDEREKREQQQKEHAPKTESQEAQAAAMKMFGKLTRTTKLFYPSRLVCKRFNVKNPHPDHQGDEASSRRTQAGGKQPLSKESVKSIMNNNTLDDFTTDIANDPLMQTVIPKPSERAQQEAPAAQTTDIANAVVSATNNAQEVKEEPPLDYERPSMDIFKAIFEDSDDDEDEEEGLGEIEPTSMAVDQPRDANITRTKSDEDDDMIGPTLPPPPEEEAKPVFRPMFKKRSRQKDDSGSSRPVHAGPMSFISTEEHIVEPFNPSSSERKSREHKRSRHDDSDQHSDERKRSSSRHHRKDSKKKKRKSDRERSRSREGRQHKKSKKRRRSDDEIDPDEIAERLVYDDSLWVEKPSAKPMGESHSSRARPKAYDMW
ncbi:hypothetical protein K450DRAFT_248993 [Umbelopsis ramanniana AG]|uniref:G-patch domain-containing protein n=1 Tax=Umbelopsis ramanniana AG TaxID=1314678 RepID=A0AAD5E9G2_UMBRA|nr:uncharacterized protein K450DRAFT_248993 [Umbelopsis ramanniana AG]KAI8578095.1 hypothetical protein K450DRAFT_248993 [Umbelopsis ramanniana AG]